MNDEQRPGFTRRSFLAGVGGVSVALLFRRHLDAVLDSLERDSAGELVEAPIAAGQAPAAAVITVTPQAAFRPERLMIPGVVVGTERVPLTRYEKCEACAETDDLYCEACDGMGGRYVETGKTIEREIRSAPWIIEDITIGGRSQLADAGGVPADLFSASAHEYNPHMIMDAAGPGAEIRFRVRYTGTNPEGEVFQAAIIGSTLGKAMDIPGLPAGAMVRSGRAVLPISSVDRIRA